MFAVCHARLKVTFDIALNSCQVVEHEAFAIFSYLIRTRRGVQISYKYIVSRTTFVHFLSEYSYLIIIGMASKPRVQLIPWDFTSPEHFQRLQLQRIACGWDYEGLEAWKAIQESGKFNLQWIVSMASPLSLTNFDISPQNQNQF